MLDRDYGIFRVRYLSAAATWSYPYSSGAGGSGGAVSGGRGWGFNSASGGSGGSGWGFKRAPALPMLKMEPALPMLSIEPALPMLRIEPTLPILSTEPVLPILRILPKLSRLPWLKALRMLCGLLKLSHPRTTPERRAAVGSLRDRFMKREAAYLLKLFAPLLFFPLPIAVILPF